MKPAAWELNNGAGADNKEQPTHQLVADLEEGRRPLRGLWNGLKLAAVLWGLIALAVWMTGCSGSEGGAELAGQHDSHAGLGRDVVRDGVRYGNTGLDLLKVGVGWVL